MKYPASTKAINEAVRTKVWRKMKFLGNTENDLMKTAKLAVSHANMHECEADSPEERADKIEALAVKYAPEVKAALNNHRCEVQKRHGKSYVGFRGAHKDDDKEWPTMEEIRAMLDGTPEDAVVITLFYDVLVPQTTPEHWSQGIRTTTKISEAVLRDNDKAKCVPSSTVAFTALSMHNNQHKWPAQYQWKQQNPNYKAEKKLMPRPTKKKDDKGHFMWMKTRISSLKTRNLVGFSLIPCVVNHLQVGGHKQQWRNSTNMWQWTRNDVGVTLILMIQS